MAARNKVTVLDIFQSLTPAEKRKALKVLQQAEQTPCERLGHKYSLGRIISTGFWNPTQTEYICSKCGHSIVR